MTTNNDEAIPEGVHCCVPSHASPLRHHKNITGQIQILVPVFYEGENVIHLYENLIKAEIEFDSMIFIYDVDADSTIPFIDRLKEKDKRVRREKNLYRPGILYAYRYAFARVKAGPVIVLMGDNSDKLELIPKMIELWQNGATIVCPSRYMKGGKQYGGGLIKSTLSRIAGTFLGIIGFPTHDPTNNFKLYDGRWLARQSIESNGGFEVALELCFKAYADGEKIEELPTVWKDRTHGKSRFRIFAWATSYMGWYFKILWSVLTNTLKFTY